MARLIGVITCVLFIGLGWLYFRSDNQVADPSTATSAPPPSEISAKENIAATASNASESPKDNSALSSPPAEASKAPIETTTSSENPKADASKSATQFLVTIDTCAKKIGLSRDGSPQSQAQWMDSKNQQALRDCMAGSGGDLRQAQEEKERDLQELNDCVKSRTGSNLPDFNAWPALPDRSKSAIQECRPVLKGWIMQSELDRLLGLEK
jgi:hypothetical protein